MFHAWLWVENEVCRVPCMAMGGERRCVPNTLFGDRLLAPHHSSTHCWVSLLSVVCTGVLAGLVIAVAPRTLCDTHSASFDADALVGTLRVGWCWGGVVRNGLVSKLGGMLLAIDTPTTTQRRAMDIPTATQRKAIDTPAATQRRAMDTPP